MTEFKQFEKNISEKFDAFHPDVDNSVIWDAIEPQLPKKRRNLKGIIIFLFSALFLGFVSIAMWSTDKNIKNDVEQNKNIIANENLKENQQKLNDAPIAAIKNKEQINEPLEESKSIVNEEKSTNNQAEEIKTSARRSTLKNEFSGQNAKQKDLTKVSTQKLDNQVNSQESKNSVSNLNKINNKENITSLSLYLDRTTLTKENLNYNSKHILNGFPLLEKHLGALNITKREVFPNIGKAAPMITLVKEKKNTLGALMVNLGYSEYNTQRSLQNMNSELLSTRTLSESNLERLTFDVNYLKALNRRWSFSIGLRLANFQEQVDYNLNSFSTVLKDETVVGVLHLLDGSQEELLGSAEVDRQTITYFTKYNTHKSISIPITVYYEFIQKSNFGLNGSLGFEKGLWSSVQGFELNSNNEVYNLKTDIEQRYKGNFGDYILFGTNFKLGLTNHWYLNAGFEYGLALNSINTEAAEIKKSYNFYGIRLGTGFTF